MHCVVIVPALLKLLFAVADADFTAVLSLVMMDFGAWTAFVRQMHI